MTVRELMNLLGKLDPESNILAYYEGDEETNMFLLSGKIKQSLAGRSADSGKPLLLLDLWGKATVFDGQN